MTLVAALKIHDTPVILGDVLITHSANNQRLLPTRPDLPSMLSSGRGIAGSRRKLSLINEQFIVGFSGAVAAGTILLKDLYRRFSQKTPSFDELNFALRLLNIQLQSYGGAELLGWVCEGEPRCFEWKATPGSSLVRLDRAVHGSGTAHFEAISKSG